MIHERVGVLHPRALSSSTCVLVPATEMLKGCVPAFASARLGSQIREACKRVGQFLQLGASATNLIFAPTRAVRT